MLPKISGEKKHTIWIRYNSQHILYVFLTVQRNIFILVLESAANSYSLKVQNSGMMSKYQIDQMKTREEYGKIKPKK